MLGCAAATLSPPASVRQSKGWPRRSQQGTCQAFLCLLLLPSAQLRCAGASGLPGSWPHGGAGRTPRGGLPAAAEASSPLPKKSPKPQTMSFFTASFISEIRIASLCCYGNARVKENDLIMIYDEISFGVGSLPPHPYCRARGRPAPLWGSGEVRGCLPTFAPTLCGLRSSRALPFGLGRSETAPAAGAAPSLENQLMSSRCIASAPGPRVPLLWEGHCNKNRALSASWTSGLDAVRGLFLLLVPGRALVFFLCFFPETLAAAPEPKLPLELCLTLRWDSEL